MNDELEAAVDEAMTETRVSPAARRFMSGSMPNCRAAQLGYTTRDPGHDCELCWYVDAGW